MHEIPVEVRRCDHRYAVLVGRFIEPGLPREIEARLGAGEYVAVADARAAELHGLEDRFRRGRNWRYLEAEGGEPRKNPDAFVALCEKLLAMGVDRGTTLVAVGGGVVGDLTGFAAATLLRGLRLVQVPTTLLAQVDSSVGGKTGINLAGGKNLLGAFRQPALVVADPGFLKTLPEREYAAGLAEVVKYGILGDRDFFFHLLGHAGAIAARDAGFLETAVAHCCRMKAEIVGGDETESGRRKLLNLGHSFGHALEALADCDGSILHGEAVSIGMAMAAAFAVELGSLTPEEAALAADGLSRLGLPRRLEDLEAGKAILERAATDELEKALSKDKKASSGGMTLILPRMVGDCAIVPGMSVERVAKFIRWFPG